MLLARLPAPLPAAYHPKCVLAVEGHLEPEARSQGNRQAAEGRLARTPDLGVPYRKRDDGGKGVIRLDGRPCDAGPFPPGSYFWGIRFHTLRLRASRLDELLLHRWTLSTLPSRRTCPGRRGTRAEEWSTTGPPRAGSGGAYVRTAAARRSPHAYLGARSSTCCLPATPLAWPWEDTVQFAQGCLVVTPIRLALDLCGKFVIVEPEKGQSLVPTLQVPGVFQ